MNMLKWDRVNIYDCLCICIFNVLVYFMCTPYFRSAYSGELMFVKCFVSEIIREQTGIFADLSLFLPRTMKMKNSMNKNLFIHCYPLFCDHVWYKKA